MIDVSEFIHLHIGGPHIVRNYVGMDATAVYRKVLHHANAAAAARPVPGKGRQITRTGRPPR